MELLMSIGIFALMGLFLLLGLKYLALLPAEERSEQAPAPAEKG